MIATPEPHPDYKFRVAIAATFREIGLYLNHIFTEAVALQDMAIFEGRLISKVKKIIKKHKIEAKQINLFLICLVRLVLKL